MIEGINYPIKYAVLELIEKGGYTLGYRNITQGFIVSKCYVVGSNIEYHSDGTNTISHKVVFPFDNIALFKTSIGHGRQNIGYKNIPRYDACNRPFPVRVVSELFESYEQAKETSDKQNEELKQNIVFGRPIPKLSSYDDLFKSLMEDYEKNLELCNLFEQAVLEETKNMEISTEVSMNSKDSVVKILTPAKRETNNNNER